MYLHSARRPVNLEEDESSADANYEREPMGPTRNGPGPDSAGLLLADGDAPHPTTNLFRSSSQIAWETTDRVGRCLALPTPLDDRRSRDAVPVRSRPYHPQVVRVAPGDVPSSALHGPWAATTFTGTNEQNKLPIRALLFLTSTIRVLQTVEILSACLFSSRHFLCSRLEARLRDVIIGEIYRVVLWSAALLGDRRRVGLVWQGVRKKPISGLGCLVWRPG